MLLRLASLAILSLGLAGDGKPATSFVGPPRLDAPLPRVAIIQPTTGEMFLMGRRVRVRGTIEKIDDYVRLYDGAYVVLRMPREGKPDLILDTGMARFRESARPGVLEFEAELENVPFRAGRHVVDVEVQVSRAGDDVASGLIRLRAPRVEIQVVK